MNFFKKLLIVFLTSIFAGHFCSAMDDVPMGPCRSLRLVMESDKFLKKYAPPKSICVLIDQYKYQIAKQKNGKILYFDGFYVKGNDVNRVINAERMRMCIKDYHLDCLDVAKKYVYPIDGKIYVFAESVELGKRDKQKNLSLEETKELATLVEETGYKDLSLQNIMRRESDNKLVIIDTEDRSFLGYKQVQEVPCFCKLQYLNNLINHISFGSFKEHRLVLEDNAKAWLLYRYNKDEKFRIDSVVTKWPLPLSSRFDDLEIDFELVKKELALFQQ